MKFRQRIGLVMFIIAAIFPVLSAVSSVNTFSAAVITGMALAFLLGGMLFLVD